MAIERLHLMNGVPLLQQSDPERLANRLWLEMVADIVQLQPGEYDLTPQSVREAKKGEDNLIVFDNGTGLFRARGSATTPSTVLNRQYPGSRELKSAGSGHVVHLPQDRREAAIVAEHYDRQKRGMYYIFDLIRWRDELVELDLSELT